MVCLMLHIDGPCVHDIHVIGGVGRISVSAQCFASPQAWCLGQTQWAPGFLSSSPSRLKVQRGCRVALAVHVFSVPWACAQDIAGKLDKMYKLSEEECARLRAQFKCQEDDREFLIREVRRDTVL